MASFGGYLKAKKRISRGIYLGFTTYQPRESPNAKSMTVLTGDVEDGGTCNLGFEKIGYKESGLNNSSDCSDSKISSRIKLF